MSENTPASNGNGNGHAGNTGRPGAAAAVAEMRHRLALVQHERRQAIYDAREAHGDRPSEVPEVREAENFRDKLPTLDDLVGPNAPKARWKLVLALAAALGGLGELARQIAGMLGKH